MKPVTVAELRARARRLVDRDGRTWAATGDHSALLEVPLHPPTERAALDDLDAARAWVATWRQAGESTEIELSWAKRNWSRVGTQEVPERALVRGAAAIARVARLHAEWALLRDRLDVLRGMSAVGVDADADADSLRVLRSNARAVAALDGPDFQRLVDVLGWLGENPASGRRVRELPIRGIDSKWIESRRGLVEALHRIVTGPTGLGLRESDPLIRIRFLDPDLAPDGLCDVSSPVGELAQFPLRPDRVFVFENLATLLAMPPVRGAVVVDGGGHRVDLVAKLPWAHTVTYWGDLDSHGFAILNRLRSRGVAATSALMDIETLLAHRDLWGVDGNPDTGRPSFLEPDEQAVLRRLGAEGNVRLEQERIPWSFALDRLGLG